MQMLNDILTVPDIDICVSVVMTAYQTDNNSDMILILLEDRGEKKQKNM